MPTHPCDQCGAILKYSPSRDGQTVTCPGCRTSVTLPVDLATTGPCVPDDKDQQNAARMIALLEKIERNTANSEAYLWWLFGMAGLAWLVLLLGGITLVNR